MTWTTKVRDNGGALATAFDPTKADLAQTGCTSPPVLRDHACTYDANGDRELWVQSQAIVRGKPRNVVARLRLEQLAESVPQTAVVAGALSITNNGNHGGTPIIDANGSQVVVRCTNPTDSTCAELPERPDQARHAAVGPDGAEPDDPEQLQRFKQRAIMDGKYFAGCPGRTARAMTCPARSSGSRAAPARRT